MLAARPIDALPGRRQVGVAIIFNRGIDVEVFIGNILCPEPDIDARDAIAKAQTEADQILVGIKFVSIGCVIRARLPGPVDA